MGTLKNIRIWLEWWMWKHKVAGIVILGINSLIFVVSTISFFGNSLFMGYRTPWITLSFIGLAMTVAGLCAVSCSSAQKNFRLAVAIGKKMLVVGDLSDYGKEVLKRMVLEAEATRQSGRLGALIKDSLRLDQIQKEISRLEKKADELSGKIHSLRVEESRLGKKPVE